MDEIRSVTGSPRQTQNAVVLLGASWHGDLEVLAPIYFCPVGTVLTFSLKIVPDVDCCARLCTESNLLLIGSSKADWCRLCPGITLHS